MDKEFVERFNDFLTTRMNNKKTIALYLSSIRHLPSEVLNKPDNELTEHLNQKILKFPTRLYYKASYRYLLEYIGKIELYSRLITTPKLERKLKKKFLSFKKVKKLVDSCDDEELKLIMMIQYASAARISEVLETTLDDIDQDGKLGTITMRIKKKGGKVNIITRYLDEVTTRKLKDFIAKRKPKDRIFTYNYYKIWGKESRLSERVLKTRISSHWFRGSRAVDILRATKNVIEVKEQLGHTDLRSTEQYLMESGIGSKRIIERVKPEW